MTQTEKSIGNQGKSDTSVVQQDKEAQKTGEPGGKAAAPKAGADRRPRASKPRSGKQKRAALKKPEPLTGRAVMRKAYKNLSAKLEKERGSSKAIDDLVKLVKLEKDLGGDTKGAKEIKVRWEQEKDKSSSEK